ncbi:MAG: HAD-IA family hydrolase [Chloroflexota bacterium]|nr:HAD-IA family hydrolase [Chloroflexota bacterium]MDE2919896.1 HAD-IA family hydrolase [Chloroflexota bacterium]
MTNAYPAAVFFDAYGTLIHFPADPSPFDYMADAVRRAGVDLPRERLDAALNAEMRYFKAHFSSVRTAEDFQRLKMDDARVYVDELGDTGPVRLDVAHMAAELHEAFATRVLPDSLPAIDAVQAAGVRVGVLSNYSYLLPLVLDGLGLADRLDPIVFSAAVGAEKPDPQIFQAAAAAVGAGLKDCVLIGDDLENDVAGGRRCGMPVVWVARDGSAAPPGVATARDLADAARMALAPGWRSLSLNEPVADQPAPEPHDADANA